MTRRELPERLDRRTTVRLSSDDRARVAAAACLNRTSLSQFARDALLTAATDCLEEAGRGRVVRQLDRPRR
jgi:uncharacterized protein (DUF1778 family)